MTRSHDSSVEFQEKSYGNTEKSGNPGWLEGVAKREPVPYVQVWSELGWGRYMIKSNIMIFDNDDIS